MTAFPENATEVRPDRVDFIHCHDPDGTPLIGLLAWDPKFHPVCTVLTVPIARQLARTLQAMADELEAS